MLVIFESVSATAAQCGVRADVLEVLIYDFFPPLEVEDAISSINLIFGKIKLPITSCKLSLKLIA
jgi:hypothetical protein